MKKKTFAQPKVISLRRTHALNLKNRATNMTITNKMKFHNGKMHVSM